MPNHRPEAVANRFLDLAGDKGLTQLQIQKLTYIAHGWTLTLTDQPLIRELPQAWDRGPVYKSLWSKLAYAGSHAINKPLEGNGLIITAKITADEESIIKQVWDVYGSLSGFRLSHLTHKADSAWHQTYYTENGRNKQISDRLTKEHYKKLANEG